jgi:hypothetical protein
MQTARRLYLYLLAGIGLGVLVSGVSLLLTTLFQSLGLGSGEVLAGDQAVRERLTLATAMSAVSLPVWLIHWFVAERSLRPGHPDADVERSSDVRGLYFALVLGGLLIAMFGSATSLIEVTVHSIAGGEASFRDPAGNLGLLLAAGLAWVYHISIRQRDWRAGPIVEAGAFLPRVYLYLATFAGLFVMLFGVADLLSLLVRLLIGDSEPVFGATEPWWSYALASSVARILVGGATWIGHWWYAGRLVRDASARGASERRSRVRFGFFVAVVVVSAAAVIGYLGQAISGLLDAAFGVLDGGSRLLPELVAGLVAATLFAVAWRIHAGWLREAASGAEGPGVSAGTRLVAYPTAAVGLAFGAVGIARLIGLLLESLFGGDRVFAGGATTLEVLADFLPYAILGVAAWTWQWSTVTRARAERPLEEGASTVRRATLLIVLAVSILAGVAALGVILYRLFGALFGVEIEGEAISDLSTPLGTLAVAAVVAVYHGQLLRADGSARDAAEVAEAADAAATPVPVREVPMILSVPSGADPAALEAVRRAMEAQLPDGYRLRDDDRRLS